MTIGIRIATELAVLEGLGRPGSVVGTSSPEWPSEFPLRSASCGVSVVVIPIRSFANGKSRLAGQFDGIVRRKMIQAMAERVVAAAGTMPVVVVSSAPEVLSWAAATGLMSLDDPGGLSEAAGVGLRWAGESGFRRVVIVHCDLPLATGLSRVVVDGGRPIVTAVPCHRDDGTPVLSLPTTAKGFQFAYGPGSFRRHAVAARAAGLAYRVYRDPQLGRDVDYPDDLSAMPTLLPTS